ncbi:MAG: PilZ domain-containing protein [Cellvibrio sp.]
MSDERRRFQRAAIKGSVLIYDDGVASTDLIDVSMGGVRVSAKQSLLTKDSIWLEFTFKGHENELIFGKRAMAKLAYSEVDIKNRRYIFGFQFLRLTEFQQDVINSVMSARAS